MKARNGDTAATILDSAGVKSERPAHRLRLPAQPADTGANPLAL